MTVTITIQTLNNFTLNDFSLLIEISRGLDQRHIYEQFATKMRFKTYINCPRNDG